MKKTAKLLLITAVVALFTTTTFAEKQTTCPVGDGKIDKTLFADINGKRVYVCCEGCLEKLKADPAKYIKELESQGVTPEKAPVPQTVCPVLGGEIDKSLFAEVEGNKIYVCCAGCIDKINDEPKKYIDQLEKQGITLDKAATK